MSSVNDLSSVVHEIAQSLLIVHAYVRGCIERIKNNNLNLDEFKSLLTTIQEQIAVMFSKLQYFSQLEY